MRTRTEPATAARHRLSTASLALALVALAAPLRAANPGDEVVVVFNQRLAESKAVAEHYAERRQVPARQVFGLSLPTSEDMTRAEFRDQLQIPLAKLMEEKKLWRIGPITVPSTNGQPGKVVQRPIESKIRYLLLCYGVPVRIQPDPTLIEEGSDQMRPELRRNEAAVDSELAWLPLVEQKLHLYGPLMNPFYTTTNAAALSPTNGILLVTRLDGPSAEVARGLVDKAMEAETNGLWGRAYFDLRGIADTNYRVGDDWMRDAAEIARLSGFETVVDTNAAVFPASFPLSQVALYAGWYTESVAGAFAQPTVEFMPGAFAYHLHSLSAGTVRSADRCWVGPLLARGATATMGCVYEPYLGATPEIGVFFGRLLVYGFTFGEAAYACTPVLSWQTTVIGDPLYRPFGKDPDARQRELERRHSPLLEWAYLRLADFKLARRAPVADAVAYLEQNELTRKSAVLMEKLGDLYEAQGKPSASAWAYEEALKLAPSPQQRVRLMLGLGEKLVALDRVADACTVYEQFLERFPNYPDPLSIHRLIVPLARKLNSPAADQHEQAIRRLTTPP